MNKRPKVIVIVGPTSSGKTAKSIDLAKKLKGEIIGADSRQIYRGLDLGSGKVTKTEMAGIPHHLISIANPKKTFSVAQYQKLAEQKIADIIRRNKTPIIVGGTGFYIQAITDGLIFPEVPPNKKLRQELAKDDTENLWRQLRLLDKRRASTIDRHNRVRLIRAIEIARTLGQVPRLKTKPSQYTFEIIGLKVAPEKLRQKIALRLNHRLKLGLVAEVNRLHRQGLSWKRLEEFGLEYRYVSRYLRGLISKADMIEQLNQAINDYAKRQVTWLKKIKHITWHEV